jgi:hypothetical protein
MNSQFYDSDGWLHAQPNVFNSENAIMFTIMIARLQGLRSVSIHPTRLISDYLLNCDRSEVNTKYKLSHDNLTAVYSFNCGVFYLKSARDQLNSYHPRDWAYYNIIENKGLKKLNYFLLSIVMIIGCARKYKRRTYGNGQKVKLVATDSKLLAWLRFKGGLDMPLTKKVCEYFIKRNFSEGWKGVFDTYFMDGHPLKQFNQAQYEL